MNAQATILTLLEGYKNRKFSPKEVFEFYKTRIAKYNPDLNCVIETFHDASYEESGPLAGIPCLVKDNICQENRITSAASRMLLEYKSPYDATVIERLKAAGICPLGRANMDEFAMGGSGEFSYYGATKNPWDPTRSPGGSSSGSAAAVAAGLIPFALGSETGGSVRQPSSFCNLVGMYPSYGRIPRFGLIAFASSTDQIGTLTRTVHDNALIMSIMAGGDHRDATSIQEKAPDFTKALTGKLPEGIRIGIIKDAVESEGIDSQVRTRFDEAIKTVEQLGAQVSYIDLPHLKYSIALYFIINYEEAASNLSRFDGSLYGHSNRDGETLMDMYIKTRGEGLGHEVKRRILLGNYVLSANHRNTYYERAQQIRKMIRHEFEQAFNSVDVLMSPTTPSLPFKLGEMNKDPITMYMADYFNVPNCMIGTPAISVPAGFSVEGLPIGVQFLGPRYSEERLYTVAHAFEQQTGFYTQLPDGYE